MEDQYRKALIDPQDLIVFAVHEGLPLKVTKETVAVDKHTCAFVAHMRNSKARRVRTFGVKETNSTSWLWPVFLGALVK